jgi:hypothetical protein
MTSLGVPDVLNLNTVAGTRRSGPADTEEFMIMY